MDPFAHCYGKIICLIDISMGVDVCAHEITFSGALNLGQ